MANSVDADQTPRSDLTLYIVCSDLFVWQAVLLFIKQNKDILYGKLDILYAELKKDISYIISDILYRI